MAKYRKTCTQCEYRENFTATFVMTVRDDEKCPECGHELIIKRGRFGEFIACTGYPECRYTRKIVHTTGIKCPKCNEGELIRRKTTKGKMKGRFFYGCNRYPDCDFVSWKKPETASDKGTENKAEEPVNFETDM